MDFFKEKIGILKNPTVILIGITILFFYQVFLFGKIPFPGDLLVAEYSPWKYESYLGYNPGSYPNKAQYFDVIRQLYPWKILAIDMIKNGELPLWNPYNFSGSPLLANNQTGVFNPFNIFFFVFPYHFAWSLYILVQPFLAAFFMYRYLQSLSIRKTASLIGSISFGFSLFMATFLEYGNFGHTILWLPALLWCVESYIQKRSKISLLGVTLFTAFSFFGGHLQLATGVVGFAILYFIYKVYKKKPKKPVLIVPLYITFGFLISAIQLIPTLELLLNSARSTHTPGIINSQFLLQPLQAILFLIPDFYGNPAVRNYLLTDTYPGNAVYIGILPLVFALKGLLMKKKNEEQLFFSFASIGLLILFVRNPLSEFIFNLPFFSASSPSNYFFLLSFSLSVLASYGFAQIKKLRDLSFPILLVILLVFFFVVAHALFKQDFFIKQSVVPLLVLFGGVVSMAVYFRFKKEWILLGILAICSFDMFYLFQKFNPFVPSELLYPSTSISSYIKGNFGENRYLGIKNGDIEANFSTQMRIYSPDGYDPLYPKVYHDFIDSTRSDAKVEFEDKKLLDSLSVRYILDRKENASDENIFPAEQFTPVYDNDGWKIFENTKALPRAFVSSKTGITPATIEQYGSNSVVIKKTGDAGRLTLTDVNYPGWEASVNGKKYAIGEEGVFRSLNVPEGDAIIRFEYKPKSFATGLVLTIMGIVGLGVVLVIKKDEKV